ATTAALGGLFAFTLFGLYPTFMQYMTGIFHTSMYVYALIFFGEAFTLYLYYYSWERMNNHKGWHIFIGVLLNIFGTAIVIIANSWASFMMSPSGVTETGVLVDAWVALFNPLWNPLNIHRILANAAFGGGIVGAFAAVKFLAARTEEEKVHYDWMGYIGNFVAICALIPLPFAGYYLGREVYSASAVMGNNMMGGAFSWVFIIQAILVGMVFISANYYLWLAMQRIPGAHRYNKYITYILITLIVCFAIWLTPHNLPLSSEEQITMGGQYHPVLKYLGLMSGKNAVINLIIMLTFASFIFYRRSNFDEAVAVSKQGSGSKITLIIFAVICVMLLGWYASVLFMLDPAELDLSPEKAVYFQLPAWLMAIHIAAIISALVLTIKDKGKLAQALLFILTVVFSTFILGVYGYIIMTQANPFLRNIAVSQWIMMLVCLIFIMAIDIFLFRTSKEIGEIPWGKMPARSQYSLIFLCISFVMLMALMGFIRSGLRENWHVYGILQDTSDGAFTPSIALMGRVIGFIVIMFLGLVSFVFWLSDLGEKRKTGATEEAIPSPAAGHAAVK
ncbi:MAG: cytochrome ubiquinol oxidase subunit I, partial [bacterium]